MSVSTVLAPFAEAGVLEPAEIAFVDMLARRSGHEDPNVLLAAALACRAPRTNNVCIDLASAALQVAPRETRGEAEPVPELPWPEVDAWRASLDAAEGLVGDGSVATPLVFEGGRLYLHRYWSYEVRLARAIRSRVFADAPDLDQAKLATGLAELFDLSAGPDLQAVAAAVCALGNFAVISGGPGTGKTTTLKRVVALLVEQALLADADARPRVLLMAPTGKAATRMREALQPLPPESPDPTRLPPRFRELLERASTRESTIHRALGVRGGNLARFWRSADDPLVADIVIVDEASMVDVALMTKLVEAVPPSARLVLVGDRHQLASVEAGAVLGDICAAGLERGMSSERREQLSALGLPLEGSADASNEPGIGDCIVHLEKNWRFERQAGIKALARSINAGDEDAVVAALRNDELDDVEWKLPEGETGLDPVRDLCVSSFAPMIAAATDGRAEDALDALDGFRVLCAHRRGRLGVQLANFEVGRWLSQHDPRFRPYGGTYVGRPLIVTENDYVVSLFNGDVGVIVKTDEGKAVRFRGEGGELREPLAPSRLPEHDTVLASTIHKSQGSQYGHVVVALPDHDSPICTRELLYTAVTRAQKKVTIVASEEVLRASVERRIQRHTGLAEALGRQPDES